MSRLAMSANRQFYLRSTLALLMMGLLTLLGIEAMTLWLGQRAQVYFDEVIAARDTRSAAVELRNAVLTAETSQRGFLLTANEIYLAPYDSAKAAAQRHLDRLKQTLASDEEAAGRVERLEEIISQKFSETDETIALKRNRQETEVLALVRTNRGKALMDEANIFFTGLIRAADERLTTGVSEHRRNAITFRWVTIVGGAIIIAVVGGAALAVFNYTRELSAARDEVAALAAGLEARVKERTADLSRANEEIQRFVYIVTHDLRAPLVNIMGFTSELEGGMKSLQAVIERSGSHLAADALAREARTAATEDLPEAIGFIRSSTRKMDNLINAMLKLAREGRRTLRPESIDLAGLVEASVSAIQHLVTEAGGRIEVAVNAPPMIGDRLALEQVFGNLVDNAVKYRSKDRPLRVEVRASPAPGDRIEISVADNGRGIAPQDLERVFELFRRSGAQDQPGEGIGLAYVRTVIRRLGGDITVKSVLDEGTTFRIVLPRILQAVEGSE
jgi:signal transduction histidine kinase